MGFRQRREERERALISLQQAQTRTTRLASCVLREQFVKHANGILAQHMEEMAARVQTGLPEDLIQHMDTNFMDALEADVIASPNHYSPNSCQAKLSLVATDAGPKVVASCTAVNCPRI